jgi:hypothetical protein
MWHQTRLHPLKGAGAAKKKSLQINNLGETPKLITYGARLIPHHR